MNSVKYRLFFRDLWENNSVICGFVNPVVSHRGLAFHARRTKHECSEVVVEQTRKLNTPLINKGQASAKGACLCFVDK